MRDWETYFDETDAARQTRPLFRQALEGSAPTDRAPSAVDLGFGHGVETLALLQAGWQVYAVDASPGAVERLRTRVPSEQADRLTLVQSDLGDVVVPPCELVWAGFSLFFLPPDRFTRLWASIRAALAPGGRFAGQLLGERDSWAGDSDTTGLTADQVQELMAGMTIEHLSVQEENGQAVSGPKHWHVFHVIARCG